MVPDPIKESVTDDHSFSADGAAQKPAGSPAGKEWTGNAVLHKGDHEAWQRHLGMSCLCHCEQRAIGNRYAYHAISGIDRSKREGTVAWY